jgi:2'-5' RNA ligase
VEAMRVFTAITLSIQIRDYLKELQEYIKPYVLKGNFTDYDNFHLTLRFIGEIQNEKNRIVAAMGQAASETGSFLLSTDEIGTFKKKNKYILWLGVTPLQELQRFYQNLESAMEQQGFSQEERPYRPHITLGRELVMTKEVEEVRQILPYRRMHIAIDHIALMESKRINGKLTYAPLERISLIK